MKKVWKDVAGIIYAVFALFIIGCANASGGGGASGGNNDSGGGNSGTPSVTYSITVTNGTSIPTTAAQGDTVTITANDPASGQVFDTWTTSSSDVSFANRTSANTTFVMPDNDVTINANYANTYSITVQNGTANKSRAKQGEIITVMSSMPPAGKEFNKWLVVTSNSGLSFANENSFSTTFTMPANAVTVKADHTQIPAGYYSIRVNGGVADRTKAQLSEQVQITANTPPAGQIFSHWQTSSSNSIEIANENSPTTTFTTTSAFSYPLNAGNSCIVTITAVFVVQ